MVSLGHLHHDGHGCCWRQGITATNEGERLPRRRIEFLEVQEGGGYSFAGLFDFIRFKASLPPPSWISLYSFSLFPLFPFDFKCHSVAAAPNHFISFSIVLRCAEFKQQQQVVATLQRNS